MAPIGYRSVFEGPWHFCARCCEKTHISEMEWQRGLLLCKRRNCIDTGELALVGSRDMAIAKAIEVPTHELEPDPKLVNPDMGTAGNEDIIF